MRVTAELPRFLLWREMGGLPALNFRAMDALDKIRRNLIGANAVYPTPFGARRAANVLGERPERARPAALPEQVAAELVFFTT